jgi:hypothetical protein
MSLKHRMLMRESTTLNSLRQDYYASLSNLTLVARSSQKTIGTALETGFKVSQIEASSYLILSLCFKEYCHATNLAVRLFGTDEFETISRYYNRLAIEHPDRHLLMFSGSEIEPILEQVGAAIRDTWSN